MQINHTRSWYKRDCRKPYSAQNNTYRGIQKSCKNYFLTFSDIKFTILEPYLTYDIIDNFRKQHALFFVISVTIMISVTSK